MLVVLSIGVFLLMVLYLFYKYRKNIYVFQMAEVKKQLEHCYITESESRRLLYGPYRMILTANVQHIVRQRLLKALELICRYRPLALAYKSKRNQLKKEINAFSYDKPEFNFHHPALKISPAERVRVQKFIKALRSLLRTPTAKYSFSQPTLLAEDLLLEQISAFYEVNYLLERAQRAVDIDQGGTVKYCCEQIIKLVGKHLNTNSYWQEVKAKAEALKQANEELIFKPSSHSLKDDDEWEMEYLFGTKKRHF
jgi:hypothetical protein